jgi:hypothetical protein
MIQSLGGSISVGAVGAAIVAGVATLVSLIISKENKTSEFRQSWIDALRSDLAEAISSASLLNAFFATGKHVELPSEFFAAWSKASAAMARIELRLNLLEQDHEEMAGLIRRAEAMIQSGANGQYDQEIAENLQTEVVALSQRILKSEWDRVRQGEATFVLMKSITILAIGLLMASLLFR